MTASELIEELKRLPPDAEIDIAAKVETSCGICEWSDTESADFKIEGVDSVPPRIRLYDQRIH